TVRDPHQSFFGRSLFGRSLSVFGIFVAAAVAPAGGAALASSEELGAQAVPVSTAEAAAGRTGLQVYNEVCIACHAAPGIGGAPALGDNEAWAARMTQGADTLIAHALNGFSGSA